MSPQNTTANQPNSGFKPKWRHFHPAARIWVQNPFDHDVVFKVADEYNRPWMYRLPAGKVSELPGGSIATLGIKAIVDELIQNSKDDAMLMWDQGVRKKHEDTIILREKENKPLADAEHPGEINLAVQGGDVPEEPAAAVTAPEQPFPGLNEPQAVSEPTGLDPLPDAARDGLADIVAASLPSEDAEASVNNAHADAEG